MTSPGCGGACLNLRRTNGLYRLRLRGRLGSAEAELKGWGRVGRKRGRVLVSFEDTDGDDVSA
ncbi:hypothetical protein [Streptomyces sp. NPDC056227]|uniref:hypothetical protein n=1 Tax=Streptomyces sp. NPDC056227 TaxID=3345753 RepID=UPI0035DB4CD3